MHAAVTSAVWLELEPRFPHRPVDSDEGGDDVFGVGLRSNRDLRIRERTRPTDSGLRMAARAIVQVEPRPQTRIVTLNVLDLVESRQARLEKLPFIVANTINRPSSARGITTDSRIQGEEISVEADGRTEQ